MIVLSLAWVRVEGRCWCDVRSTRLHVLIHLTSQVEREPRTDGGCPQTSTAVCGEVVEVDTLLSTLPGGIDLDGFDVCSWDRVRSPR